MEASISNSSEHQNWMVRSIHANAFSRHLWQILLAWSLILVWAAIFCIFLEGKSSYDLAFTLWDDEYAKISMEPMGKVVVPQFVAYMIFFVITALIVAIIVNSHYFKLATTCIVIITGILIVLFVVGFGITSENFIGGRQGTTGWTILEYPWLSLLLFCFGNASGTIGVWFLISQEIPLITTPVNDKKEIIKWPLTLGLWMARVLIIIMIILGNLALNAGAILFFDHVNAIFVISAIGCTIAMGLIFFKKDIFQTDFKKRKQVGKKRIWLFTPNPIMNHDGTELNRAFDFFVNPRNIAWRSIRNVLNGILTAVCMLLIAAMCFLTVPDEWVFTRFFDLLPWMIIGVLIGVGLMTLVPEPAIYYPAMFIYIVQIFNNFRNNVSLPFDPGYIAINGGLFGFWISIFVVYLFYAQRTKTRGRNFNLTVFLALMFSFIWIVLCYVDRVQGGGDSVMNIVIGVVIPIFIIISQYFLYFSIGFWGLDIAYRIYRKYKPPASSRQVKADPLLASRVPKREKRMHALQFNISDKKKKIISLLILGIFIGSFSFVQITYVYGNEVRPLLYRNDDFGIWTVDAVTKVEKDFPIQMPGFAPIESDIQVAAARGEWNGFHLLISPQPEKSVTLGNVSWTAFTSESGSDSINVSSMNVFLVSYLVDEQPDQLLDLYPRLPLTRTSGEHVDLYFQVLVPRNNATSGMYDATIYLNINFIEYHVLLHLQVYNFTIPLDNHLRTAFGGGWNTNQWYDELQYLRISQQDMGIPFNYGQQYWWNTTTKQFQFNWTLYHAAFEAQLKRGFTGFSQDYSLPDSARPAEITNDTQWANIKESFLHNVSIYLENQTWVDETGTKHSWIEIPYLYIYDEPAESFYPTVKEAFDRYHANGTSKLRTLLTEEYNFADPILNSSVDIWCPVIDNFEPSAVVNRHAAGQQYWFYTCVAPTAPYPNIQLWEQGNDPELLPLLCARFNADGFLYWSMTTSNFTYRAGYDGNGDGQLAFVDPITGRPLPSLRLLSFSLGVEDYECIWLMRATIQDKAINGTIPTDLLSRAAAMETRLNDLVGARPSFVNHDPNTLASFKSDLSQLLEYLWPYSEKLYA